MSINFIGREGCPHIGAGANSLVFEKVLDALEESRDNLQEVKDIKGETLSIKNAAELAKDGAVSAKSAAESANQNAQNAKNAATNAAQEAQAAMSNAARSASYASDAEERIADSLDEVKELAGEAADNAASASAAESACGEYAEQAKQYSGKPAKAIDGTWWIWNAETGQYEDSGASAVLSIQHSYPSIAAMNADFSNTNKNDMAIISSSVEEEDTAKLYINNGTEWAYLCDLSGVQGVKGDAATVTVGTVTVGAAGSDPSVTNVGTSAAAVLNFVIPKGDKGNKGDKGDTGDQGDTGVGISDITLTSGNHAPGSTDTYTVHLTNGDEFTFQVYNGANGTGAGDLMADGSVPMTGDFDAGGYKVTNLAAPEADNDAVRKSDLDSLIITSETQPDSQPTNGIWYKVLS